MKKEDLFDTLGDINSEYIMEAHMKNKRKNRFAWTKWGTIAACFALLLVLGIPMINNLSPVVDDNNGLMENSEVKKELEQSGIQDLNNKEEVQNVETEPSHGADNPVVEMEGNTGALIPYEEVWGGSYPNEDGQWVIWLTENTAENQRKVLELNPTLKKENVVFKTAAYSLEYLTDLMKNMSLAVGRSEEFLFVSSIGLREEKNCIDVYVTTNDLAGIAKLLEFDTIGGAIEIIYLDSEGNSSGAVKKEPITQNEGNIDEDVPADSNGEYNEAVTSSDLTKDTSKFFGGSYTDNNGNFVIVLTEDTPENRAAICKELGRNENNTTFVTGTYTLEYLTELQAKISNAMANKELPFVVSSGLSETTNSIVVGITTTDEAELAKVYAFDTLGGAIKIEFSSSATKDLLLAPKAE